MIGIAHETDVAAVLSQMSVSCKDCLYFVPEDLWDYHCLREPDGQDKSTLGSEPDGPDESAWGSVTDALRNAWGVVKSLKPDKPIKLSAKVCVNCEL
jgi:hypothetical protein